MEADVRTAIVTGGSHGIGRAIAKALARGYYTVAVLDRGKPEPWTEDLADRIAFHRCDVGNEAQLRNAIQSFAKRHSRLDALVNNAGIMIASRCGNSPWPNGTG